MRLGDGAPSVASPERGVNGVGIVLCEPGLLGESGREEVLRGRLKAIRCPLERGAR